MKTTKDLTAAELKSYAERGIIKIVIEDKLPTRIEETPEYKKHSDLAGQPIHVSEASRKYDIPHSTLSRYATKGIIKKLKKKKNKTILDESYVAYVKEVFKTRDGQGKWMFNDKGLPYTPSTR